jgi:hypothetical protein
LAVIWPAHFHTTWSPLSGVLSFSVKDDLPASTVVRHVAGAGGQIRLGPLAFCASVTTSAISSLSARSMSPSLSKSSMTAHDGFDGAGMSCPKLKLPLPSFT